MYKKAAVLLFLSISACKENPEFYRFDIERFVELGEADYSYLSRLPKSLITNPSEWDELIDTTGSPDQKLNLQLGQLYFLLLQEQMIIIDRKTQRLIFVERPLLEDYVVSTYFFEQVGDAFLYFSDKERKNYAGFIRREKDRLYMERGNKIYPYKKQREVKR